MHDHQTRIEKPEEPAPLLLKFSLASMLSMLLTALILIFLYRQDQLTEHGEIATQRNTATLEQLQLLLGHQFHDFVASSAALSLQALRHNPNIAPLAHALNDLHQEDILKVKLYNQASIAVYSSAGNEIGGRSHHPDWLNSALLGKVVHHTELRKGFMHANGIASDTYVALVYAPLIHEGKVTGVIEIYTDASLIFERLRHNSLKIAFIVLLTFSALYAVLILNIRKTDRAISKWKNAIEKSEALLRESQRIAGLGNYILDVGSGQWTGSAVLEHLLGIDQHFSHTVVGWQSLIHPDDREMMTTYFEQEVLLQNGTFDKEYRIIRANDQAMRWVHGLGKLERDSSGTALTMHGTIQDITERKQFITRIQHSEGQLRAIFRTQNDLIWLKDQEGIYLACNPMFERFFGSKEADIIGKTDYDFVDKELADFFRSHDRKAMLADGPSMNEEWITSAGDGHRALLETVKAPMRDDTGRLIGVLGIARDITERRTSETELRIASAALESESLIITDADSVILRVNKAFTDSTGFTAEEVIGRTPRLLKSGHHNEDFYHDMWKILRQSGKWQGEIWDKRKNGEIYPKWLTITAVKDNKGLVTHYVGSHVDITERKASEESIKNLAFYDPLTLLPNRRLLLDRLKQALISHSRRDQNGALLFIDLDNFKTLNDTLGHDTGDILLQQVAQRLSDCIRQGDTAARLGGDEFVVMLESLSGNTLDVATQTESVANKILISLREPYQLGVHEHYTTPSIGITLFNGHQDTQEDLLKQADIAMYQAKKAGRNTLRFFDTEMEISINTRATLEKEMRSALDKQQFCLHYQIQVDSARRPLGAEALIRWQHPERGLVSPAHFIPLIEENGLILPIGLWVLETVCAQLKLWESAAPTRDLVLSLNVSSRQFRQNDFASQVIEIITRHAINPQRLKLELTESLLLDDIENIISTMNELKKFGVQFSLDDFGTGYSSLQYLKRLPLDQLKIDQSFVRDLVISSIGKEIVRTIIAMAHTLSLDVIAEGVEAEEQCILLQSYGCSSFQGYLFSKPVPIEQLETKLRG